MARVILPRHTALLTRLVARRIGRAFAQRRIAAGHQQRDVCRMIGLTRYESISRFETGEFMNVKLGVIMRFLTVYGLTLAVVPEKPRAIAARQGE